MASIELYIELIKSFISDVITAKEFETKYLRLFKLDSDQKSEEEFLILDELFADVDAFCTDPELREKGDIDEEELKKRCEIAITKLMN